MTPANSVVPNASKQGTKAQVAHGWKYGYIAMAASRIPNALERGAKS